MESMTLRDDPVVAAAFEWLALACGGTKWSDTADHLLIDGRVAAPGARRRGCRSGCGRGDALLCATNGVRMHAIKLEAIVDQWSGLKDRAVIPLDVANYLGRVKVPRKVVFRSVNVENGVRTVTAFSDSARFDCFSRSYQFQADQISWPDPRLLIDFPDTRIEIGATVAKGIEAMARIASADRYALLEVAAIDGNVIVSQCCGGNADSPSVPVGAIRSRAPIFMADVAHDYVLACVVPAQHLADALSIVNTAGAMNETGNLDIGFGGLGALSCSSDGNAESAGPLYIGGGCWTAVVGASAWEPTWTPDDGYIVKKRQP